ncbi:MAG: hypothetical protein LBV49_08335 [Azonexus sp.]|jgi:alpha-tubulin suppressor-like RCC1 family protein|nr:hypothetical protein [Azonexus sp.]
MKHAKKTILASAIAAIFLGAFPLALAYTDGTGTHCGIPCSAEDMQKMHSTSPAYVASLGDKDAPRYGNQMAGGLQIEKVKFGYLGGLALDSTGRVYTWGYNNFGRLGIGMNEDGAITKGTTRENIPANRWTAQMYGGGLTLVDFFGNPQKYSSTELTTPTTIVDIGAGYQNNVAVDVEGRVWAWGNNSYQVAGQTTGASYNLPKRVPLPADKKFVKVWGSSADGAFYQAFALTDAGELWSWGSNDFGKQGTGSTTSGTAPHQTLFPAGTVIVDVEGGYHNNMALDSAGNIWVWGGGNLGDGGAQTATPRKLVVTGMGKALKISMASLTQLVLDENHNVWQWGVGWTGYTAWTPQKVKVAEAEIARVGYTPIPQDVEAGELAAFFIDQHGRSWAWGSNGYFAFGREGGYENSNDINTVDAYQFPQVLGDGDTQVFDTDKKTPANGLTKNARGNYGFNELHPTIYDDKYAGKEAEKWVEMALKPIPKIKKIVSSLSSYAIVDEDGNLFRWALDGSGAAAWGNGDDFVQKYDYTGNARDGLYDAYLYEVVLLRNGGFDNPDKPCDPKYTTSNSIVAALASNSRLLASSAAYVASYSYTDDPTRITRTTVGDTKAVQWGKVSGETISGTINGWNGALTAYTGNAINGTPLWQASIPKTRNIFTTGANGSGLAFQSAGLSSDPAVKHGLTADVITAVRNNPLGDILNSQLAYVGKPARFTLDEGFTTFASTRADRKSVVYVGANDGMLHGFDAGSGGGSSATAGSGKELMAYVPRGLLSRVEQLTAGSYTHEYFVDGSPVSGDARIGSASSWATVLAGALGRGGAGYFVLDVTDPDSFAEGAGAWSNALIDSTSKDSAIASGITEAQWDYIGSQYNQPVMDQTNTTQSAQIVQINKIDGSAKKYEWAVIMGNGYNSVSGLPVLLVQSLAAGMPLYTVTGACVVEGAVQTSATTCIAHGNGLGAPRPVDIDGNGTADIVYAGDLEGNLWKFNIASPDTSQWIVANGTADSPKPLFSALGPTGAGQPITSAPVAVVNPKGGFLVEFGTGKNLTDEVDQKDMKQNTFYAINDNTPIRVDKAVTGPSNVKISQVLFGADTAYGKGNKAARTTSPIPATCRSGSGPGRYSNCLYQQTGGTLAASANAGLQVGVSSDGSDVVIDNGATEAGRYGWYYDIPEVANGNMGKVLSNPVLMPGNVVMFYTQNLGALPSSANAEGSASQCPPPIQTIEEITTVNFFDQYSGGYPNVTISVTLGGSTLDFNVGAGNRFRLSGTSTEDAKGAGVGTYIGHGRNKLKGVEADSTITVTPPIRPGRRAGWHIAR